VENFTANSVFQGKVKKISIQYIQPVNAITLKFLVWENTTRKKLYPLELNETRTQNACVSMAIRIVSYSYTVIVPCTVLYDITTNVAYKTVSKYKYCHL